MSPGRINQILEDSNFDSDQHDTDHPKPLDIALSGIPLPRIVSRSKMLSDEQRSAPYWCLILECVITLEAGGSNEGLVGATMMAVNGLFRRISCAIGMEGIGCVRLVVAKRKTGVMDFVYGIHHMVHKCVS